MLSLILTLGDTVYSLQFADDQLLLAQDFKDTEYMTRKLIQQYQKWGLKVNMNKTKYLSLIHICINIEIRKYVML